MSDSEGVVLEDTMKAPFNRRGGLTLVPMPGFEDLATRIKWIIEQKTPDTKHTDRIKTPVDVVAPEISLRPSGEPFVRLGKQHIGEHDCFILTSGPGTPRMLTELIFVVGYLASRKASVITIICPYFPLGRSDKDEGGWELSMPPFVVRSVLGVAQGLVKRIVCVDPHAQQIAMAADPGLITPVYLTRRILKFVTQEALSVSDHLCLAFPDDSAAKRYEAAMAIVERELKITFNVVSTAARRTSGTEKSLKYIVGDTEAMQDAIVVALDDETATGGTQMAAAKEFKERFGAREVWAAVTHGILCGNGPDRFMSPKCPIERLYVTDTIPLHHRPELQPLIQSGRIRVISWEKDLAEIVYNIHHGRSIRDIRGAD